MHHRPPRNEPLPHTSPAPPTGGSNPIPGLDLNQLRARRRPHPAESQLPERIGKHLDAHDGYVAFSGGKDSLVALHLTLQIEPNVPVVWFDSGLEYPETVDYISRLQQRWNLQLHRIPAEPTLLQILYDSGAWDHTATPRTVPDLHHALISRPAAQAHQRFGDGEVWGLRADEARGRAALYVNALRSEARKHGHQSIGPTTVRREHGGVVRRVDGTTAFGPIWDWTDGHVWAYIARHQLPVNPVYNKLRRLGAPARSLRISHLIDGNQLEAGRAVWLCRGWPTLFNELAAVLPRVREFI